MLKNWVKKTKIDDTPVDAETLHGISSNWAYDHAVDLDAHTRNIGEVLRTGAYIGIAPGSWTKDLVANTMYAVPFVAVRDITVDRVCLYVSTLAAGKSVRLGIYNNGTNLYPGTLVIDAGVVSVASTGIKLATVDQSLPKGIYWLAAVSDGTPKISAASTNSNRGRPTIDFHTDAKPQDEWDVNFTYAALPDPFTAGGNLHTDTLSVGLFLRLASLD